MGKPVLTGVEQRASVFQVAPAICGFHVSVSRFTAP
jgi:hypothetical protein